MKVTDVHRRVLDNLLDGVLVVGLGGLIETLNPAAARILGVEGSEAAGSTFADLFVSREGFDAFTELVIDAIGQGSVGDRQVVEVQLEGETRSLSVSMSYLRAEEKDGREPMAVIAVFSDITELRTLREAELRMAKAVEAQHTELQTAYRQIEDRNEALAAALRKVRVAQGLGMFLVIGLFLAAGLWTWRPLDLLQGGAVVAGTAPAETSARPSRTLTVTPRRVSSSISLQGRLAPWRQVDVRSAVDGTVTAVHFEVGAEVSEGDVLVELDVSRTVQRYQKERVAYLEAREKFETLANWEKSAEMSSARRSFSKAKLDLENQRNRMSKTDFLFKEGLISASEYEAAQRQNRSQLLDFEAAKDQFEAVRAQGGPRAVDAARVEMESARTSMTALKASLEWDRIRAPLTGLVLVPARAGKELVAGAAVRKGQKLLQIGDFSRMAAVTTADEIDVVLLRSGQQVSISGNAFPGLTIQGVVKHVSAQADPKSKRAPLFNVAVLLDDLGDAERGRLRVGMSANLRIVTYSNPKALLVPIEAVSRRGRQHRVWAIDPKTGEPRERVIEVGPTTRNSVEITAGLNAGDRILLPKG